MQHTARPVIVAAALATLLLGSACGSTAAPAAPAAAPTSAAAPATTDPVVWTNGLCGSLLPFVTSLKAQPNLDPANPGAAIKTLSDYLGKASADLGTGLESLKATPPSPISGGDAVVASLTTTMTTVKSALEEAKTKVDASDPNNPQTLTAAFEPLQKIGDIPDPTAAFKDNPDLAKAFATADNCKAISAGVAG